jgi:hypothetical protein
MIATPLDGNLAEAENTGGPVTSAFSLHSRSSW